jgi:hypothetical protein
LREAVDYIVIGVRADAFRFRARLSEELIRAALRFLHHKIFGYELIRFLAGNLKGAVRLFLGLRQHAIALTEKLLGLLHFLRNGDAHLVDDIQHAVLIDHHIAGQWDGLALIEQFFQTID